MKRILALILAVLISTSASAGVPTVNIPDLAIQVSSWMQQYTQQAQQIAQYETQIEQYYKQISQLETQIEQYKQQYNAITGARGFGDLLTDLARYQYIPQNVASIYDDINTGNYSALSSEAKALRDKYKLYDCSSRTSTDARASCEASFALDPMNKAYADTAMSKTYDRTNTLDGLRQSINQTTDPKGIAEAQARIAAEQAQIANETNRLLALKMQQDEARALQDKRNTSDAMRRLSRREDTSFTVDWGAAK